ncbi:MAG: DUF4231 domain-containing protein [Saprospiraceae bacterium]
MSQIKLSVEDYLKNRIQDQIDWYDRKSVRLKKRYRRMKFTTIVFGVLIPVAISLNKELGDFANYTAAFLGAAISALEGISGMLKDKDTFIQYRMTREALNREKFIFITNSGHYATAEKPFQLFVDTCEAIMSGENNDWRSRFEQDEDQDTSAE